MRYLVSSPAVDRLGWILDGLNGVADWGGDAADVLAPEFAALMPPDAFAERVRQRAAAFAPGIGRSAALPRLKVRGLPSLPPKLYPHRVSVGDCGSKASNWQHVEIT